MSYFPDVNVWMAILWQNHKHHEVAIRWLEDLQVPVHLCRVTQMALVRLISNPAVMGKDVVSRASAWHVIDELEADSRTGWSEEPAGLEAVWRTMSARHDNSYKLWTDDYLAAFAQAGGFTLVTLDKALGKRHPSVVTLVLEPS